jgi:hypothetical protein
MPVKLSGPSMEARLNARLRNSGDGTNPAVHVQHGDGARRTHHNIHMTRNVQSGPPEGQVRGPSAAIGAPAQPKAEGKR